MQGCAEPLISAYGYFFSAQEINDGSRGEYSSRVTIRRTGTNFPCNKNTCDFPAQTLADDPFTIFSLSQDIPARGISDFGILKLFLFFSKSKVISQPNKNLDQKKSSHTPTPNFVLCEIGVYDKLK